MAKSSSRIIVAGLAGLVVGMAVGMLIAPDKGSKTRKRLKKKLREVEEAVRQSDFTGTIESLKSIFRREKDNDTGNESTS